MVLTREKLVRELLCDFDLDARNLEKLYFELTKKLFLVDWKLLNIIVCVIKHMDINTSKIVFDKASSDIIKKHEVYKDYKINNVYLALKPSVAITFSADDYVFERIINNYNENKRYFNKINRIKQKSKMFKKEE